MSIRTYSELIVMPDFESRYEYLRLDGLVGDSTFGFDRFLNQFFYKSTEYRKVRNFVIIRDNGCDLGMEGYEIRGKIIVHHLNPISIRDIETRSEFLTNPEYLICTTHNTHNAIHYGDSKLLVTTPPVRTKNDTCPWKINKER